MTDPTNLEITYSDDVWGQVLEAVTFGYYNAQMTVTISAEDATSGVAAIYYNYDGEWQSAAPDANGDISFVIDPEYRGNVKYYAVDNAGNDTDPVDGQATLIVDTIRPGIDVTWSDAVTAKNNTRYYLNDCVKLNWDLDDWAILFPPNLEAAHQRTISMVKHQASKIAKQQFQTTREKQLWMEWQNDGLLIRLPLDGDEIIAEGKALHHCVGGYVDRAAAGTTTILFIRRVSDPDTPYFTLEYLGGNVHQCKTNKNGDYTKDEAVREFVAAWVKHINRLKTRERKRKAA